VQIYKSLKKSSEVSAEQAAEDPQVKELIAKRVEQLSAVCEKILNSILKTIDKLPYGLRLICKQIRQIALERFPKTKQEEIFQVIGYFIYYRFLNAAVVSPDAYNIGPKDMPLKLRKSLVPISKVFLFFLSFFLFFSLFLNIFVCVFVCV
jgi:Ras GTPase-activating-like protein IQGAP2/3